MFSFELIASFLLLSAMMCGIPGPTTLYVLSQGLSREWRKPLFAIAGITCSNLIWISFCSIGIGTVIHDSQFALNMLRICGACYLVYLGISHWRNTSNPLLIDTVSQKKLPMVFFKGFLTSITNPKALLFYMSFLPQFTTNDSSITTQIFILGLLNITVMTIVLSLYSMLGLKISQGLHNLKLIANLKRIIGSILIAFGVSLVGFGFENQ